MLGLSAYNNADFANINPNQAKMALEFVKWAILRNDLPTCWWASIKNVDHIAIPILASNTSLLSRE